MKRWQTRTAAAIDRIWYGDSAWRWPLWPVSVVFRSLAAARAGLYRRGMRPSVRLPVPVVVVGNVTVGGTGKTPLVIWLARELAARGRSPGIVTRGYGGRTSSWPQRVTPESSPDDVGDEPVLLAARTARPVHAGPDRVAAAESLLEAAPGVDVIVSDDGLQHYRLARAFEIAVVDAARGLGNGLCLPAGPLREPPARLETVDAVVVNEGSPEPAASRPAAAPLRPPPDAVPASAPRVPMSLRVTRVYRLADGAEAALEAFAGRTVHALAGIGHPERFFRMLEGAGISVLRHPLPDHARLRLEDLPRDTSVPVLTTEKDGVKLRGAERDDVWCVAIEAAIEHGAAARLLDAIDAAIEGHRKGSRAHAGADDRFASGRASGRG